MARDADGQPPKGVSPNRAAYLRHRQVTGAAKARRGLLKGRSPTSAERIAEGRGETRGRRSISQRTRDNAETMRSVGTVLESSKGALETVAGIVFIGAMVFWLAPKMTLIDGSSGYTWGGRPIQGIGLSFPNRYLAKNVAVVESVILTRDADLGGLLALGGTALTFTQLIEKTFEDITQSPVEWRERWGLPLHPPPYEMRGEFILHEYLPRLLYAIFIGCLFWMILRYVRSIG